MPQTKKVKGYVYILTNPSFREDWVKIWKSSRPVNVRSKELDNTSVPLPFEIYATLQTEKYNLIEKQIHKILEKLAGKRIRKEREFFNIWPKEALNYLSDYADLIDDAIILWPNYYQKDKAIITETNSKPPKLPKWASSSKEYHFRHISAVPKARLVVKNWEYIVKKWSTVCPIVSDKARTAKNSRNRYKDYIKDNKTTKDIAFKSPSWAWDFVYWNSTNWKWSWLDNEGNTLWENINNWI